jgi:preprotein translocase subunit SecA
VEYQREGYQLFQAMNEAIKEETIGYLFHLEVNTEEDESDEDEDAIEIVEEDAETLDAFSVTLGAAAAPAADSVTSTAGTQTSTKQRKQGGKQTAKQGKKDAKPQGSKGKRDSASSAEARAEASGREPAAAAPKATKAGRRLDERGLGGGPRSVPLQYSAPSETGDGSTTTLGSSFARSSATRRAAAGAAPVDDPAADGLAFPGTPRNAQCPCGSGKKYKLCHGKNEG